MVIDSEVYRVLKYVRSLPLVIIGSYGLLEDARRRSGGLVTRTGDIAYKDTYTVAIEIKCGVS